MNMDMDYKNRLDEAYDRLRYHRDTMRDAMDRFTYFLTDLLWPCGEHGCLIGSEDYCEDLYYVCAEPKPNEFYRVTAVRNKDGRLQVRLALPVYGDYSSYGFINNDGWMDITKAHIADLYFLADEVINNLEYSDGYQPEKEDEFKYIIDEDGSKYNPETSVLSGGMDTRCAHNEEALFAYKTRRTAEAISEYLLDKGWIKSHDDTYLEFRKGNTSVFFDDWRDEDGIFVCFGTEYHEDFDRDIKALAELKAKLDSELPKTKRYVVPFLRSQWTELTVEADGPDDAIDKAEQIFRDGKDGFVEWEDVDRPEYDEVTGVSEA